MPEFSRLLFCCTLLSALTSAAFAHDPGPVDNPVPSVPQGDVASANPVNTPVTASAEAPDIPDIVRPASLEAMMAIRPGYSPGHEATNGRDQAIRQAAWAYGARCGLAARSYAINEMLRRYTPILDQTCDFHNLVLPASNGMTLIRSPVVTEAQMALALAPGGQTARETGVVFQIEKQARLVSAMPQWRTWLVRAVNPADPPSDILRPRTVHEVNIWRECVAKGWEAGERQAVEILLDDLARLERDIIGMARYRVLLKAGKVAPPIVAHLHRAVEGGHDLMRIDDSEVRIRVQPGLDANRAHWHVSDVTP